MDTIFGCPLCFNPMASSTDDEGKTKWWCLSNCLLPWTIDKKKPALMPNCGFACQTSSRIHNQHLIVNCMMNLASWKWSEKRSAKMKALSISCSSLVQERRTKISVHSLFPQSMMAKKQGLCSDGPNCKTKIERWNWHISKQRTLATRSP